MNTLNLDEFKNGGWVTLQKMSFKKRFSEVFIKMTSDRILSQLAQDLAAPQDTRSLGEPTLSWAHKHQALPQGLSSKWVLGPQFNGIIGWAWVSLLNTEYRKGSASENCP